MRKTTPKKSKVTRSDQNQLFKSNPLPNGLFPTSFELVEYYYYLKDIKHVKEDVFLQVAIDLVAVWHKANIPTIMTKSVRNKLKIMIEKETANISKNKNRITEEDYSIIKSKLSKCFVISKCQCFKTANSVEDFQLSACVCCDTNKIPECELSFYANQLFRHELPPDKVLYISPSIDKKESEKLQVLNEKVKRRLLRKEKESKRLKEYQQQINDFVSQDMEQTQEEHESEPNVTNNTKPEKKLKFQNTLDVCGKLGLSPQAIMMVINAGNLDRGIVDEDEYTSESTVSRWQEINGEIKVAEHTSESQGGEWFQVDGRKDTVLLPGNQ